MLVIITLRKWRQKDCKVEGNPGYVRAHLKEKVMVSITLDSSRLEDLDAKVILGYLVSSRTFWDT